MEIMLVVVGMTMVVVLAYDPLYGVLHVEDDAE